MALSIAGVIGDRVISSPGNSSQIQIETGPLMRSAIRSGVKSTHTNNAIRLVAGAVLSVVFLTLSGAGEARADNSAVETVQAATIDKPDVNDWG
ncbi:hypothetical protein [Streptomyces canus]|uniref:hypothetical protein n=1 Tax=Streptomyces canus TaxID=58343 RepID=UPI002DDA94CF|nr:hypothetical protein [Streptomyces canus]WSD82977.1 hypothetical protein OG925_00765 [Streptomyces canus]WSD91856.1 hypothetical protein OG925_49715 [Streptomyces canus]WSD92653.1 hypothetical protein OG925_51245 [Streptomyces canus]